MFQRALLIGNAIWAIYCYKWANDLSNRKFFKVIKTDVEVVRVFPKSKEGGNPAPTVLNATGLSENEMKAIAGKYGLESGFVLPVDPKSEADYRFRFFVPEHEMEMCGHATIGALWLLRKHGKIRKTNILIDTLSGIVTAHVPKSGAISITQPKADIEKLCNENVDQVLKILGLNQDDLAKPEILNSCTSRVKTLIPLKSRKRLDDLIPDFSKMKGLCEMIGSTGIYPFAAGDNENIFHARQFPRSSGYPEDAATGIAASALAFGLLEWGLVTRKDRVAIRQGEAMGRASEIIITFDKEEMNGGCRIHGNCELG
ncbi:MAG: PhzF family phenazine biosynthesis protein [Alphaproteobacteria bacterium]|nr:PhzF family phenazine biosynthesis protein [Alphaproteobacteria bacterium]